MDKVLLVVAVVAVALGDDRIDHIESAFNDVVHLGDVYLILAHGVNPAVHKRADVVKVLGRECYERAVSGFFNRGNNLLNVIIFFRSVLFNNLYHMAHSCIS